jgi:hypothetical protein
MNLKHCGRSGPPFVAARPPWSRAQARSRAQSTLWRSLSGLGYAALLFATMVVTFFSCVVLTGKQSVHFRSPALDRRTPERSLPAHTAQPAATASHAKANTRASPTKQPAASHFTTHGVNEFTCEGAHDKRQNCTRCLPGWRGVSCEKRVAVQPCTLPRCISWARCPWGTPLRVYVHPTPKGARATWMDSTTSAEYRDIMHSLRSSRRSVPDARDACLLVPWFDTLCIGNRCTDTWTDAPKAEALGSALERLPGWKDGANHLVFDMSSAYAPTLPINRGIYAATSFWAAGHSFRHGYDQPIPLWNQRWRTENSTLDAAARRSAARPLLLTFKGQRMFWCGSIMCAPNDLTHAVHAVQLRPINSYSGTGWVRNQLGALDNGQDVIIASKCARELADAAHCGGDCALQCDAEGRRYDALDFRELLLNSTFGLVLPGITPMSYRLAETLSYGAVPVIASDFLMLPFAALLDWHAFSVRVSESQLLELPQLLRALPRERVAQMQASAVQAYERCFSSPGKIALCTVEQLEVSMFGRLSGEE